MSGNALGIALAAVSLVMLAINVVMTRPAMARLRLDVGLLIAAACSFSKR
jgi:hypothetical protein